MGRAGSTGHGSAGILSVAGHPTNQILIDEERVGIVGRSWKFIQTGDTAELYSQSLQTGPGTGERTSNIEFHGAVIESLRAKLRAQLESHALTIIDPGQINDELRETLRVLGYLDEEEAEPPH